MTAQEIIDETVQLANRKRAAFERSSKEWMRMQDNSASEREYSECETAIAEMPARIDRLVNERMADFNTLQELHLKRLGLWEEFRDGGCDIFHWMGTAIVTERAEIASLRAENTRLVEALERRQAAEQGRS